MTNDPADCFTYNALSPETDFRILILEPGETGQPLRCNLRDVSLENVPFFEAISYVWDNQERSEEIICHGRSMFITPALELILRRMRLADQSRAVWADSVCINQADLPEKGHQVGLMAEIYRNAGRTLLFSGNYGKSSVDDEACANDLQALMNEVDDECLSKASPEWYSLPLVRPDHPLQTDERWICMKILSKNRWFTRGWVVQEAAVAANADIVWGNSILSWSQVMRVAWFAKTKLHGVFHEHLSIPFLHMSAYLRTHKTEMKPLMGEDGWTRYGSQLEYFQAARGLGLSNSHDRIYAFINLPTYDKAPTVNVIPDYAKSFEDVCQDLATRMVEEHQNLDVICFVNHGPESFDSLIPSWVPLWLHDEQVSRNIELTRSMQPVLLELDKPLEPKDGQLQVRGARFAEIKYVSKMIKTDIKTIDDVAALWSEASQIEVTNWTRRPEAILMFVHALASGTFAGEAQHYSEHMAAFILEVQRRSGQDKEVKNRFDWEFQAKNGNPEECLKWILLQCHERVLVVTERGYGLASLAQVGDDCAILQGGKMAFVLRHVEDDKFRLVSSLFHSSECSGRQTDNGYISGMAIWEHNDWEEWDLMTEDMILV